MDYKPARSHLSLLLFTILCSLACGCATLLKGPNDHIDVVGPPDALVHRLDSVPVPLQIHYRSDSSRYLVLPSDTDHRVIVAAGNHADTLLLRHQLNGLYIVADVFATSGIGLIVDGITQAWHELDGEVILYGIPDTLAGRPDATPGWVVTRWEHVTPPRPRRFPNGVVAMLYIGAMYPVVQVPIGNIVGIGLGYEIIPDVEVIATYEFQGCTTLTSFTGDARPRTDICGLIARTFAVQGRYWPLSWAYLSAGAGGTHVEADSLAHPHWRRTAGFSADLPTVNLGVGVAASIFFLEYRAVWGTRRIVMDESSTGLLRLNGVRFGFNMRF